MIEYYIAQFASLVPNNECELCSNYGLPFVEHKEKIWLNCPSCGRCCAKYFFPLDGSRRLIPVPDDYVAPVYGKPKAEQIRQKKKEDKNLNAFFKLLQETEDVGVSDEEN